MIDSTDWLAFLHDWRKSCRGARVALCMLINISINLTIQQSLLSHKLENRLRWVVFGSNLDPVVAASNSPIRSPVIILAPPKVFRLFLDRFKNLSDTIRSTFNSAAEQSCSGTKVVPELAFPVWTGALSNTHFATFRFHCPVQCEPPGTCHCSHGLFVAHGQLREASYPLYNTG